MYPLVGPQYRVVERYRYAAPVKVATPQARRRDYLAAVTAMDASIGKMLDLPAGKGILDDTIVIFFADNGGAGGLFDLDEDIGESRDLSPEQPDVLEKVRRRYRHWVKEMEAAEPRGPFRDF